MIKCRILHLLFLYSLLLPMAGLVDMAHAGTSPDLLVPLHVVKGTNLITIARAYCRNPTDWRTIARVNRIDPPYVIYAHDTLRIPLGILWTEKVSARVESITGEPELVDESGRRRPLQAGETILPGQTVQTDAGEFVQLVFPGDKHTRVEPQSELTILYLVRFSDDQVQTGLFVNRGRVVQDVRRKLHPNEHFETRTTIAVTGVRGTSYRVKAPDSETTLVETIQGRVSLRSAGREQTLTGGRGTRVRKGHPPEPQRLLPAQPETLQLKDVYRTLPVVFDAPRIRHADRIRLRLATDPRGFDIVFEQVVAPGEPFTLMAVADGRYQALLTSLTGEGFESIPSLPAELYVRTNPPAPVISSPRSGLVTFTPTLTITWLASEQAREYTVQIARDPDFRERILEETTTTPSLSTPRLDPGTYYFRVRLTTDDGFSTLFSTVLQWTVMEQPKMDALAPAVQGEDGISLQWTPSKGVAGYQLQVAEDREFSRLRVDEKALPEPSFTIVDQLAPGTWYVRMRAYMKDVQTSPWTREQILTVEPGPLGIEHLILALGFLALIIL